MHAGRRRRRASIPADPARRRSGHRRAPFSRLACQTAVLGNWPPTCGMAVPPLAAPYRPLRAARWRPPRTYVREPAILASRAAGREPVLQHRRRRASGRVLPKGGAKDEIPARDGMATRLPARKEESNVVERLGEPAAASGYAGE